MTRRLHIIASVTVVAALGLPLPLVATSQTMRCESADGKVTYANAACPDGTRSVRTLPPAPEPTPADAKAARDRLKADRQQVQQLEREQRNAAARQERERAAQARQQAERDQACRALALKAAQADERVSKSTLAKREAAEKTAQKARARYAAQCSK